MYGIYNYIPETNRVSRLYTVAAVLYLQSVLHIEYNVISPLKYVLYFYISASRSVCVCVQCPIWLFVAVP